MEKKFIRLKEAAELRHMDPDDAKEMSRNIGALYKVGKLWIVNCEYLPLLNNREGGFDMNDARDTVTKAMGNGKKFVRYNTGAEMYSMGLSKFVEIARDAGAVYKVGKMCLVNCEVLDRYLEGFRLSER